MRKFVFVTLVCLLAAGTALAQGVKGGIAGTVVDEGGVPLPGVTIALTSPAMPGAESAVTDTNGFFRFVRLAPGQYKAVFALSGYQRVEQENIQVNIAEDVRLDVTLRSAFTEEVVVTSESPLVDTTATTIGVDLSSDFFMDLPVGRNYTSVAAVTPGAQDDDAGQTFYGSTGAENAYYIDGVNTTGVELGQQGKTLNFEFIQEVQVKTGGYNAEHGRSTGGLVNVITKSGGNEFHGDVFGYYDDDSLQDDLKGGAAAGALTGSFVRSAYTRSDYGADLGGFFVKDKLWFFAAYDYVDNSDDLSTLEDFSEYVFGAPSLGDTFERAAQSDLYAAKLTWRVTGNHSLSASIFGDPTETDGVLPTTADYSLAAHPNHFTGVVTTGGDDYAVNYDGVFGQNFVLSARLSSHEETYEQTGPGTLTPSYFDFTDPLGDGTILRGWGDRISGFGFYQDQDFGRDQYNLDASLFVDELAGQHEFKIGAEFEDISVVNMNFNGGSGQRIYRFACDPAVRYCGEPGQESPYYYRHRFFLNEEGLDATQLTLADVMSPLSIDTKAENYAAFLQDRWQPSSSLTFNLGVRWERQKLFNSAGDVSGDIDDNWAYRLGFVWDFMGNGKSKLYAHAGDFYETIPMDIVIRSFGGEISIFSYNLSDNPEDVANDNRVRASRILGGEFSPVDPDLKGQYITEYVLGAEYEVMTDLMVGAKVIRRDLGRVIEDALTADGHYYIGNPGTGLLSYTYDIGYAYGYGCPDADPDDPYACHLHAVPAGKRTYEGTELVVQKRFSNNFQFIASAVIGRLYGNYDGTFQASTGQLDPNLNSAYDYYDFSVNNQGYLSGDRRKQFKVDGIYRFDWGLSVGASAFWRSGTPITAFGYSTAYNNWEYFLSNRGAFGRTADEYEADLHLGYPIKLGGDFELNLLVDVFNLLNRQGETSVNDRYTVDEAYQPLNWETGLPNPPITPENMYDRMPTNSSFGTTNGWQTPRSIRLGARLSF